MEPCALFESCGALGLCSHPGWGPGAPFPSWAGCWISPPILGGVMDLPSHPGQGPGAPLYAAGRGTGSGLYSCRPLSFSSAIFQLGNFSSVTSWCLSFLMCGGEITAVQDFCCQAWHTGSPMDQSLFSKPSASCHQTLMCSLTVSQQRRDQAQLTPGLLLSHHTTFPAFIFSSFFTAKPNAQFVIDPSSCPRKKKQ